MDSIDGWRMKEIRGKIDGKIMQGREIERTTIRGQ